MAAARLTGILLVGGASRRFGSPKALARFEGETLAERAWRTLGEVSAERIAAGKRSDSLRLPFDLVDDGSNVRAALVGIVAGLRAARTERAVFLPVDMPLVRGEDLRRLADACADAAVPTGSHPLPCVLQCRVLPVLEACVDAGNFALREAFATLDPRTVQLDERRLINVNTASDLAALSVSSAT